MAATRIPKTVLVAEIDYIEVDMPTGERTACSECDVARSRLDKAISVVAPVLDQLGIHPKVRPLKIRTAREAQLLKVQGSPSVRIAGLDLHPEHRDLPEAAAAGDERVWHWQGREYSNPPLAMFTQALLRLATHPPDVSYGSYEIPPYLKRYVAGEASP